MNENAHQKVAILGAGPAGLRMAAGCQRAGIPYTVYERHSEVGGLWDINRPDSPMYEAAHFISSKRQSAFHAFPMPAHFPDYPSHRHVFDWLKAYAEQSGVRPAIRFDTEISRVIRTSDGWHIETSRGERVEHAAVVLAHGSNWVPRWPDYPGVFNGEQWHSSQFKRAAQLSGKRVLIVGAGNSGCDIACEAARSAEAALLSMRRGYHFLPKHLFGIPSDEFSARTGDAPIWLKRPFFALLKSMVTGDVQRLGLPRPTHRLFESHPIMNTQVLHYLQHGDLAVRGDIATLDGDGVQFKSGQREPINLIIYATGYEKPLHFVDCGTALTPADFRWQVFAKSQPSLYSMSLFETNSGAYPLFDVMADAIVADIVSQRAGDGASQRFHRKLADSEHAVRGGLNLIDSERHLVYVDSQSFRRRLRALTRLHFQT